MEMGFCLAMPLVYYTFDIIYIVFQSCGFYNVPQIRYLLPMLGHFWLWHPSWTDRETWPRFHTGVDLMSGNNYEYLLLRLPQAALLRISKV